MELKFKIKTYFFSSSISFNRTAYGIEILLRGTGQENRVLSFNRTAYGIEISELSFLLSF